MGHVTSECKRKQILAAAANALNVDEERSSKASSESEHEHELGQFGFFNTLKTSGRPSSPPTTSADSDHYDADADSNRSSVSSNKDGENFGWFCMSIESPSIKGSNKSKKRKSSPHYEIGRPDKWRVKSAKPVEYKYKYETSALQHVLHQPSTQQMTGTPRTQWKEIDTVADTLRKLSLLTSNHRTSSQEGGII